MPKRLSAEQIEEIARRVEAGGAPSAEESRVLCAMAGELLQTAPSPELVRLATVLVSSRGALPMKPADAAALGAAVLKAAQGTLLEEAARALREAGEALRLGRNWIEGLERVPLNARAGRQIVGLARSMTKTLHRHLTSTAETLNFGMAGPLEPLDPAEPAYKEVPPLERLPRRQAATELERAHEALRVARLGLLKVTRFMHTLGTSQPTRVWDEALAQQAARIARDAAAHLAELSSWEGE